MTELLAAAEDFLAGRLRTREIIEEEIKAVAIGRRDPKVALENIDLKVETGSLTALLGPSGIEAREQPLVAPGGVRAVAFIGEVAAHAREQEGAQLSLCGIGHGERADPAGRRPLPGGAVRGRLCLQGCQDGLRDGGRAGRRPGRLDRGAGAPAAPTAAPS